MKKFLFVLLILLIAFGGYILYDKYLKPNYKGYHTWPAWNTVFTHRKTIGDDEHLYKMDVAAFEKKYKEVCSSISEE